MQRSIHLWATGDENLSACSFFIIRDIASKFSSDYLDICLMRTYRAFIANCNFMDPANLKHIKFLMHSIVEIYSLDIQKSSQKVLVSVQQLASILRQALKIKKKVWNTNIALVELCCFCSTSSWVFYVMRFIAWYRDVHRKFLIHDDLMYFVVVFVCILSLLYQIWG